MRKFKKGFTLIEIILTLMIISIFLVLLIKINYSFNELERKYIDKYLIYTQFHNVIQIIKSDPDCYLHIDDYYNMNGEKVHNLVKVTEDKYNFSIYFDEFGNLTYQSNAFYYIDVTLVLNDYTDYYDYYYHVKLYKSNVVTSTISGPGVYLHYAKKK